MKTIVPIALTWMTLISAPISASAQQPSNYAEMCERSVTMPPPFGESDLKGNPKLHDYCACFGGLFAARAMSGEHHSAQENIRSEREMRATCRNKYGLPPPPVPPRLR
jgi:hypothetical protein